MAREQTFKRGQSYTLRSFQNDVFTLRATLQDEDGDSIDLTGKTIRINAKISPYDASVTHAISGTIITAASGIVDFAFTGTHTANVREFFAEVEYETTGGAGDIETLLTFKWLVLRDAG